MAFLEAHGLTRAYGDNKALTDFALSVERGEIFALVGPDGAGKTTLIRILCRLIDADAGQVAVNGFDAFKEFDLIKPDLGYMPQQFSLYPDLSVEENLMFYGGLFGVSGRTFREKCEYLYEFSNLGPFAKRRAQALSGGMKQKLALSCALIHDPKLLILDEPTTGVDPLSRRQFWEILLTLKSEGVAILVSTPYMDEVARCDQAAFIFGGRKLSEAPPKELARQFEGNIYYVNRKPEAQLVAQLNHISDISASRFGSGLHVYLPPGRTIDEYEAPLAGLGIELAEATAIEPGLEDRFIQLMGTQA